MNSNRTWFRLFWVIILTGFMGSARAFASSVVKKADLHHGDEVVLTLDSKFDASKVSTEYSKDIIQLTLSPATVYPAMVKSSAEGVISKVFIYQYTPKVVRCRITMKGAAEAYKKRLKLSSNGKTIQVKFSDEGNFVDEKSSVQKIVESVISPQEEQKRLQEKIAQAPLGDESKAEKPIARTPSKLAGAKPMPSFWSVFLKLGFVVSLFGLLAFLFKRYGMDKRGSSKGFLSKIQKVSSMKFGTKDQMIEVLATQHLGPKKTISVVRVAGRLLVLGLSHDSIQLITQISDSEDEQEILEEISSTGGQPQQSFADFLGDQKPSPPSRMESQGVRSRIRSRLEGLKPL